MKNRNILIVDSPNRSSDLRYVAGFGSEDPVVLVKRGKRIAIVVPAMEQERVKRSCPQAIVHTPGTLGIPRKARRRLSNWAAYLLRSEDIRKVVVPSAFPVALARRLETKGFRVSVAGDAIFPERAVKVPGEVDCIRRAQQAGVFGVRRAVEVLKRARVSRDGMLEFEGEKLTAGKLRKEIMKTLLDHSCMGRDIIVAPGMQAADPHEGGHGPIKQGEGVVIDIFPQHMDHGYWGDISRTVVKGEPAAEYRKMYHAVKEAQEAALSKIRPGVKCATVHKTVADEFQRRGFKTEIRNGRPCGFIHSTGHGVGLDIHESPSIAPNETRLRKGNVITIEPGLYYPGLGGVRIEDTVEVTASSWRYLARCEKTLEV
jgi:Xaa-Pro aminopeptidase